MKTKIKFINRFIVLTLLVIITGCNDELYEVKDEHNSVDKNKISLAQFKNETNIGKVEPILSVSFTKSISSKTKTQLSDFVIDTLAIKKLISENNKTTYSFRIYPLFAFAKPNEIYNLVYRKVNNTWETSIFYLKKLPERDSENKLFEKIERIYDSKSKTSKTYKISSVWDCTIEVPVLHCTNTGQCKATGVCDNCIWCVHTVISYANCSSGGGSSGGAIDPGNTSGSGGGASDPYSYSPNYFDNPVFDDPEYINAVQRSYVWTNLGDAAQGFFASSQMINYFNQTIQYQITNTWSTESYVFAEEMRIRKLNYPMVFNTIAPFLIEKNINDINLNPCPKGVFTAVKNTAVCDIAQVLAKLDANGSVYNTTIKSEVAPSGRPAQTVWNSPFNYTIYISTDYSGKTKLFIAASMLHELVHAYFMSLFDDYNNGNPTNPNAYNDFSILFQKFVDKTYPGSNDVAHHEQMAIDYVNAIAAGLQEYQPGLPQQVYQDLAWGGLQEAPIFNTLFPDGSAERLRIINRYTCESQGTPYGQGTPQVQVPVGSPCN